MNFLSKSFISEYFKGQKKLVLAEVNSFSNSRVLVLYHENVSVWIRAFFFILELNYSFMRKGEYCYLFHLLSETLDFVLQFICGKMDKLFMPRSCVLKIDNFHKSNWNSKTARIKINSGSWLRCNIKHFRAFRFFEYCLLLCHLAVYWLFYPDNVSCPL